MEMTKIKWNESMAARCFARYPDLHAADVEKPLKAGPACGPLEITPGPEIPAEKESGDAFAEVSENAGESSIKAFGETAVKADKEVADEIAVEIGAAIEDAIWNDFVKEIDNLLAE